MAYADYDFYKNTYIGSMSENDFTRLSERATDYINSRTDFALLTMEISDELNLRIKKACCSVADAMYKTLNGGDKLSESVAGYSVTYNLSKASSDSKRLDDIIQIYIPDLVMGANWI